MKTIRTALIALALGLAFAGSASAQVMGPDARPGFMSYEQHAANWWQWALSQPVSSSPVLDTTGANCGKGQYYSAFYLAGTLDGSPVTRSCTVNRLRPIVFPVINGAYFTWPKDSADTRTESFVRSVSECMAEGADLFVVLDGVAVENPADYLEFSNKIAPIWLPTDNVFGVTALDERLLDTGYDTGYYVGLNTWQLSRGKHTLRFGGQTSCGVQDVTYELTVQ